MDCWSWPVVCHLGRSRSFIATRNHVDGEGSTITFSFRSDQYLYVSATVMNWLMNNDIYRGGASQEWKSFADNLKRA
jgi:hypothetical protein